MTRFPFLPAETPTGMAHRGGTDAAPENTLEAFRHAQSLGYRYFETDVHLTSDGELVAFHDAKLDRVAGRSGTIADFSLADLQALDLGGGATIPTMASLFEEFPDTNFNIEPKSADSVEPLAELIQSVGAVDRVCIGAFSDARITQVQALLGPQLCTSAGPRHIATLWAATRLGRAWSSLRENSLLRKIAEQHGCLQIPTSMMGIPVLDSHFIELASTLGLQVHVWTINDEGEMSDLLDAGVDMVMTDNLSVLKGVLSNRGQW